MSRQNIDKKMSLDKLTYLLDNEKIIWDMKYDPENLVSSFDKNDNPIPLDNIYYEPINGLNHLKIVDPILDEGKHIIEYKRKEYMSVMDVLKFIHSLIYKPFTLDHAEYLYGREVEDCSKYNIVDEFGVEYWVFMGLHTRSDNILELYIDKS